VDVRRGDETSAARLAERCVDVRGNETPPTALEVARAIAGAGFAMEA